MHCTYIYMCVAYTLIKTLFKKWLGSMYHLVDTFIMNYYISVSLPLLVDVREYMTGMMNTNI